MWLCLSLCVQVRTEVQRLRAENKEEKRRSDKLQRILEVEKEANAQAQRIIESIRNLDTSDVSDAERGGRRSVRARVCVCVLRVFACVNVCVYVSLPHCRTWRVCPRSCHRVCAGTV